MKQGTVTTCGKRPASVSPVDRFRIGSVARSLFCFFLCIHVSSNQLLMRLTKFEMGSTRRLQGQMYAVCAGAGGLTFTVLGRGDETVHVIMRGR